MVTFSQCSTGGRRGAHGAVSSAQFWTEAATAGWGASAKKKRRFGVPGSCYSVVPTQTQVGLLAHFHFVGVFFPDSSFLALASKCSFCHCSVECGPSSPCAAEYSGLSALLLTPVSGRRLKVGGTQQTLDEWTNILLKFTSWNCIIEVGSSLFFNEWIIMTPLFINQFPSMYFQQSLSLLIRFQFK